MISSQIRLREFAEDTGEADQHSCQIPLARSGRGRKKEEEKGWKN